MSEKTVVVGRWYPSTAPVLDGEDSDAYTDRVTGADGSGLRPYDHVRYRQCSIGWHMECSRWRSNPAAECACPCHTDTVPRDIRHMPAWLLDVADRFAELYCLPDTTGRRVMAIARHAAGYGQDVDQVLLAVGLGEVYGCAQSADLITDVASIYHAHAKKNG